MQLQQQFPWFGKTFAYRKHQKYAASAKVNAYQNKIDYLKFDVKKHYYLMYQYAQQKDVYLIYSSKLRTFLEELKIDSLSNEALFKKLKYEQELVDVTKKMQLIDGEYQKAELHLISLVNDDEVDKINLPLELAMPEEDGTISFSDTYENPEFLEYENNLLAIQQAQKFNNKWLPNLSLGFRYVQIIDNDQLFVELPVQNVFEPQLRFSWNFFTKEKGSIKKSDIEQLLEKKVASISTNLQLGMNDQISARIAYFSVIEKLENLNRLQNQIKQKQEPLKEELDIEFERLKANYEFEKVEAVTNYYISSSKMLLYQ